MIRIFKLTNGVSIIATVNGEASSFFFISNVFMIERRINEAGEIYEVLSCYTSYIKDKEDQIELSKSQIVFSFEPSESFSKYYKKVTDTYWTQMYPVMSKIIESYVTEEEVKPEPQENSDNVVPMKPNKTIH